MPKRVIEMSHARLDFLIGQAHASVVDVSAADIKVLEAEWGRRCDAAGEDGLVYEDDR